MSASATWWRPWVKAVAYTGAGVLGFVGLAGFAHTDAGRPLLHWFAKSAGCPVDLEGGDPARVESYRIEQLKQRVGTATAKTHPALGFELGRSTRQEVELWSLGVAGDCKVMRKGSVLSCQGEFRTDAPAATLPASDVYLQFDAMDRLVAVDVFYTRGCGNDAVSHLRQRSNALSKSVGEVTHRTGEMTAKYLTEPFRRTAIEFRYEDYVARVSATNLGSRGIRVREQYQWLPEG